MTPVPDEADTRRTLLELCRLGTPQTHFDALVRMASRQLGCAVAWLALLDDENALWLRAAAGLAPHESPAIAGDLMASLLAPGDKPVSMVAQAAAARISVNGHTVGMLCVMDTAMRAFDDAALAALRDTAQLAGALLDAQLKEQGWPMQDEPVRVASLSSSAWLWESEATGRAEQMLRDKQAGSAAEPAQPAAAASAGLRMLYVEDNRINALLFEEAMRMHSSRIELRVAEDGAQALSLAQDWQPEVLVLDAHLPGVTGFEVLRQLRSLPGLDKVPAYMCSADAMPDDVQRAYEAGFIGYWTKPLNVSSVFADIEQCVQRSRGTAPAANPG